jgi:hypothetical protein
MAADLDVRAHDIDGTAFVCFTQNDARDLLQLTLDFPKLTLELSKYKELADVKDKEILTLKDMNLNLNQQNSVYVDENVRLHEENESMNKWYRSPYLWFCVGLFVGAGISIGIALAVK